MKTLIALAFLLPLSASAAIVEVEGKYDLSKLRVELAASGITLTGASCVTPTAGPTKCRIEYADTANDPMPVIAAHVYVDPFAKAVTDHNTNRVAMVALAKELKNDTTPTTFAQLLAMVLKIRELAVRIVFDIASE